MITGVEVIGLTLGVSSLTIQLIKCWRGAIENSDIRNLTVSLQNIEQIYLNSVTFLLKSIVSNAELRNLLSDPKGSCWSDEVFKQKVSDHLGRGADRLIETSVQIHKTLSDLQQELKLKTKPSSIKDPKKRARIKQVVTGFVHGSAYRSSLRRLKSQVEEFRMLSKDSVKLAPLQFGLQRSIENLSLIQEAATYLYNALKEGWECDCEKIHPTHMQLDIWTCPPEETKDVVCLKFRLLFADNAEKARATHWRMAEIKPSEPGQIEDLSSSPTSDFLPECPNLSSSQSRLPRPVSRVPIEFDQFSSAETIESPDVESDIGDEDDFCSAFSDLNTNTAPIRHRLGSFPSKGDEYDIFVYPEQTSQPPRRFSISVSDILCSEDHANATVPAGTSEPMATNLDNRDRVRLGLIVAWGVLQLSSTDWLSGHWTRENILLVMDRPHNPQPFVSHGFRSMRRASSQSEATTLLPSGDADFKNWVKSEALFALAVFLLEMGFRQPIEELAEAKEKDESTGRPHGLTPLLTAQRLSSEIHRELGIHYAEAINACLHGDFKVMNRNNKYDSEEVAYDMLQRVIGPLESAAGNFGVDLPVVAAY